MLTQAFSTDQITPITVVQAPAGKTLNIYGIWYHVFKATPQVLLQITQPGANNGGPLACSQNLLQAGWNFDGMPANGTLYFSVLNGGVQISVPQQGNVEGLVYYTIV